MIPTTRFGMNDQSPATIEDEPREVAAHDHCEAIAVLCTRAREALGPHASFRLRVLLDMVLLELDKERARLTEEK